MEGNKENKERHGIIYKIENTVNGKCYIGQTTNKKGFKGRYHYGGDGIEKVYKFHKYRKDNNFAYIEELFNDIEKYGFKSFTIEEELDIAHSKEELDLLEKKYIKEFNCIDNGYNSEDGGRHGTPCERTRKKQSEASKGENNGFYGMKHTEEAKEKMRETRKKYTGKNHPFYGRSHTEETKLKISQSKKGTRCPEEKKIKLSNMFSGGNNPRAKKVICLNDNVVFDTIEDCRKNYKKGYQTVIDICNHKKEQTKDGLVFMYYDEYLQQQEQQDQTAI